MLYIITYPVDNRWTSHHTVKAEVSMETLHKVLAQKCVLLKLFRLDIAM